MMKIIHKMRNLGSYEVQPPGERAWISAGAMTANISW